MKNDRNYTVDLCKYLFSLLVISIHVQLFSDYCHALNTLVVQIIARAAVPFFAVCTGYYINKNVSENKAEGTVKAIFIGHFKRILFLYIVWSVIYLLFSIPNWIRIGWFSFWAFIDFGMAAIKQGSHYHLWYLLSLLYALPLFFLIIMKTKRSRWIIASLLLYTIELLTYSYSFLLPREFATLLEVRREWDALFSGVFRILPFLLLGAFCYGIKKEIYQWQRILLLIFVLLMQILEVHLLNRNDHNTVSYIIMTYPIAYVLIRLIMEMKQPSHKSVCKSLGSISAFIYCFHPMIIESLQFYALSSMMRFVIVSIVATAVGMIVNGIRKQLRAYRSGNK